MTIQRFVTIKWQETKLSMIKMFKFFVSDHLTTSVLEACQFILIETYYRKIKGFFKYTDVFSWCNLNAPINCFQDGGEGGRPPGNWLGKVAPGTEI